MVNDVIDGPPPELRYRRRIRLSASLGEVWRMRELVRTLAERDVRVRYKQAILGVAWAVLTPLALLVLFTMIFKRVANVDTNGVPYQLFSFIGLIPWTLFSSSITSGGQSLIQNKELLNKVYCPREVFPIAGVAVASIDALVQIVLLGGMFALFVFAPRVTSLWIPVLLVVQMVFTLGVTLLISGVVVYLRDLRHALPVILQLGLFATPVAYGMDEYIPESLQTVYSIANPLAPVIEGYRRVILFGQPPEWDLLVPGAISAFAMLLIGYVIFKRLETGFADVA
jgi:ABC-type polysaccharide/polyol phosphate export permease